MVGRTIIFLYSCILVVQVRDLSVSVKSQFPSFSLALACNQMMILEYYDRFQKKSRF
jgi:hypothetical protein